MLKVQQKARVRDLNCMRAVVVGYSMYFLYIFPTAFGSCYRAGTSIERCKGRCICQKSTCGSISIHSLIHRALWPSHMAQLVFFVSATWTCCPANWRQQHLNLVSFGPPRCRRFRFDLGASAELFWLLFPIVLGPVFPLSCPIKPQPFPQCICLIHELFRVF